MACGIRILLLVLAIAFVSAPSGVGAVHGSGFKKIGQHVIEESHAAGRFHLADLYST